MLVEHVDEGTQRVVEDLVDAVPALGLAPGAALLDLHVRDLGGAHHVADADGGGRTRQAHAAVASAQGLDQPRARQQVDDLEDVLLRDVEALRQLRNLDQARVGARAVDQDADGVAGRFGQSHRCGCPEAARLELDISHDRPAKARATHRSRQAWAGADRPPGARQVTCCAKVSPGGQTRDCRGYC
jgi:hypothetical protein